MRYTELQISGEGLDQPEFLGEPRKVFLCSTPRSGSYLLCRAMINAGVGVPHEYFNPIVMRQIAPRFGLAASLEPLRWWPRGRLDRLGFRKAERAAESDFLARYIGELAPRRCQNGVFAAKIHFRDYLKVLDNPQGCAFLDGGLFIHLFREDMLKQAISTRFAELTGRWGIDDAVTTPPSVNPDFFDTAGIDRSIDDLAEQDRGWRVFLASNGLNAMSISYERLCKDPFAFVVAIAARLGLDANALRQGYRETAAADSDPTLPDKGEVARRYLASRPRIKDFSGAAAVRKKEAVNG